MKTISTLLAIAVYSISFSQTFMFSDNDRNFYHYKIDKFIADEAEICIRDSSSKGCIDSGITGLKCLTLYYAFDIEIDYRSKKVLLDVLIPTGTYESWQEIYYLDSVVHNSSGSMRYASHSDKGTCEIYIDTHLKLFDITTILKDGSIEITSFRITDGYH